MTPHDLLLAQSARVFGFAGDVVKISLPDGPVAMTVSLDEHEHTRRARLGLGAITDREIVTALWELPHAMPVEQSAIPDWARPLLDRAPTAAVAADGGALIRENRPPLTVSGALAVGRRLERLVRRVGQLSAVASMAVVVQGDVDRADPWMLNAALYGIGVASSRGGQLTPVSEPRHIVPTLGAYRWWICELAYKQILTYKQTTKSVTSSQRET